MLKTRGDENGDDVDMLYIAFTGADAVPGANDTKWDATSAKEFEDSLAALSDKLVRSVKDGNNHCSAIVMGARDEGYGWYEVLVLNQPTPSLTCSHLYSV